VSEKSGVIKENCWTVVLVVVHRVFCSHFIISLKMDNMVAETFFHIIILCFVNKLNSSMSNFGGRLSQPKKIKQFLHWPASFFHHLLLVATAREVANLIMYLSLQNSILLKSIHFALNFSKSNNLNFGTVIMFCK
jgi:hypothetical protein